MRMSLNSCILVACCFASTATADVAYKTEKIGDDDIEVARMTVTPAAEPVPALRYRLIARDIDLKAGNAAPFYYRALLESTHVMKSIREKFDEEKELSNWYAPGGDMAIADLPLAKVRVANDMFNSVVTNYLVEATSRRNCDWQLNIEDVTGAEIISYLLPEFQGSREFSRMLALRTRLAIAEHRYDDAIEALRQNYRVGHDVATVPLLVCGLVGLAIDGITNGTVAELVASPNAPNLYWALTELPQPHIELRPSARFELDLGHRMFPFINHAESTERAPEEWNRLYSQSMRDFAMLSGGWSIRGVKGESNDPMEEARVGFIATGLALGGYSHAKAWLINHGMAREQLEKMAVGQVMAIYSERIYQRFADEFEKCWYVPFADMAKFSEHIEQHLIEARLFGAGENREVLPIASLLLPAMQAARGAQVRLEREIAALRVIEALRMYAAEHNRELPKSLDEITAVPVPLNPATGKPFVYRLDGKTAVLELPPSDGIHGANRRYEIQIAEK